MRARTLGRLGILTATAAVAVLVTGGPAAAHVTVNPGEATQGGFTKLAFRVPNESDTASTTKLEVAVPTQAPIAFVSVKPVPGWTAATETTTLATPVKTGEGEITEAVSKITWMSTGADSAIKPGQFQEFEVSAGPLPEVEQIIFKAVQTYSDATVVRWIDEPVTAGTQPEHPAPVLKLAKKASTTGPLVPAATTANEADDNLGGWALSVGIAALVAALAALALAMRTSRRGPFASASPEG